MITGNMLIMFIIGFIIFCFYIAGLIYAIYWGHNTQRQEMMNDPELRDYYNRHNNYDGEYEDDGYEGHTAQIPVDVYKKIMEYVENKDFLFMGVA